jgi:hypothetical protein
LGGHRIGVTPQNRLALGGRFCFSTLPPLSWQFRYVVLQSAFDIAPSHHGSHRRNEHLWAAIPDACCCTILAAWITCAAQNDAPSKNHSLDLGNALASK